MAGKTRRQISLLVLATVLGGFALLLGFRYNEAIAARESLQQVQVQAATAAGADSSPERGQEALISGERARWQPRISVNGTLVPARDAALSFKGMGRLADLRAKVGDRVKAGQLLAELDGREVRAQLAVAHAQTNTAEVQLQFAQENERRTRTLYENKAVSESSLIADHQRTELARVQLETAQAQLELARTALAGTELVAPFAGSVIEAPSAPGANVAPGVPLFRIQDTSSLTLNATLSPADAALAKLGEQVEVSDSSGVHLGRITAILPTVDPRTRRLPITAELPNQAETPLLANLFVRATIVPAQPIDVLKFPASVLVPGSQDEVVAVHDGASRSVHIVYASDSDGSLLVRDGLSLHDVLVAAPSSQLPADEAPPEVSP